MNINEVPYIFIPRFLLLCYSHPLLTNNADFDGEEAIHPTLIRRLPTTTHEKRSDASEVFHSGEGFHGDESTTEALIKCIIE